MTFAIIKAFALKNWQAIAATLLLVVLWGWHASAVRTARADGLQAGRAEVQAQWAAADQEASRIASKAESQHRETEKTHAARLTHAQSTRAVTVVRDTRLADSLRTERDGLRADLAAALATCGRDVPGDPDAARRQRTAAIAAVFADMEREGAAMAGAASGHAADSLMYQQAWPK